VLSATFSSLISLKLVFSTLSSSPFRPPSSAHSILGHHDHHYITPRTPSPTISSAAGVPILAQPSPLLSTQHLPHFTERRPSRAHHSVPSSWHAPPGAVPSYRRAEQYKAGTKGSSSGSPSGKGDMAGGMFSNNPGYAQQAGREDQRVGGVDRRAGGVVCCA
jgi:hypothetical protein